MTTTITATVSGSDECEARNPNVYYMIGLCLNCLLDGILMIYRAGDVARSLDCPSCNNRSVTAMRHATVDEIPAAAETSE